MARRLATVISQAPALRGTPDCGHCSSAATTASWASSSASPTSPVYRASPAMSRAHSIRTTASIAAWVCEAVTTTDDTTRRRLGQVGGLGAGVTGAVLGPRLQHPGYVLRLRESNGGHHAGHAAAFKVGPCLADLLRRG